MFYYKHNTTFYSISINIILNKITCVVICLIVSYNLLNKIKYTILNLNTFKFFCALKLKILEYKKKNMFVMSFNI